MVIDFQNMEEKPVEGFKGGVGITNLKKFENELGKIILGRLEPGASIGLHTHETNSEAIYIVSGTADFIYDPEAGGTADSASSPNCDQSQPCASGDQNPAYASGDQNLPCASDNQDPACAKISETVSAGGCHYCPKGHTHSMINNSKEDIIFFAVIPEQA